MLECQLGKFSFDLMVIFSQMREILGTEHLIFIGRGREAPSPGFFFFFFFFFLFCFVFQAKEGLGFYFFMLKTLTLPNPHPPPTYTHTLSKNLISPERKYEMGCKGVIITLVKCPSCWVISPLDLQLWGPWFESRWKWNSAHDCTAFHYHPSGVTIWLK